MKIGVVTMFKHTPNYGGALQAYALPTFLCKMGHEAEQIFFDDSNVCEREKLSCLKSIEIEAKVFLWNMIQRLKHPLHTFKYQCRFREMVRFGMDVTPHSNKFYHYNDIAETANLYEMYIVGSDVVWTPTLNSPILLLKFVPEGKRKISYAASFGTSILTPLQQQRFKADLANYHAVSVREKSMISVLESATGKKVEHCLDPTLLLEREDWDKICSPRIIGEPYAFSFFLGNNVNARITAIEYAKKKGLKLVNIPYLWEQYSDFAHFGDIRLSKVSPKDFISLIKYSEYIFTDSFHVCVFSQIYQRNFFTFRRNSTDKQSIRITDFLELTGFLERFCGTTERETYAYCDSIEEADYNKTSEALQVMRQQSIEYLICNTNVTKKL
ncbi:polysaccharide pyruvyl transferase family protein [Bacteroides finegoldii]|jgi:hypothetical protein|uniref:polysaccharide pyruvyl transferase family protein n=1 Tax=Bacteroides finegoldii TaxID=338188 RepID=UPI00189F0AF9|nr:polysaccharide pyruvyl transferase family protein [Bacteroides finegoldii]